MRANAIAERDLELRCARALSLAARAVGVGTRQQVRAAARAFVRRHRGDRRFLAFALRNVLANSALALALLGFAPAMAHATGTVFVERTGAANPLNGMGGVNSAIADLDADGDLDLLAAAGVSIQLAYYENTGSATSASFAGSLLSVSTSGPAGYFSVAAFADLDADGDLDLFASRDPFGPPAANLSLGYFENTGSATLPVFVQRTGSASPLDAFDDTAGFVAVGDLDADGDLDLIIVPGASSLAYFENTGTATNPAFVERTGSANPVNGLPPAGLGLRDLDGDGDLDLQAQGNAGSTFFNLYFENVGNARHAVFVARTGGSSPLDAVWSLTSESAWPTFGDVDGDGDLDWLAGSPGFSPACFCDARVHFAESLAGRFVPLTGAANPLDAQDTGYYSTPALGDLDADGDLDVLAGQYLGTFAYLRNIGSAASPAFAAQTGGGNPLNGQDIGSFAAPALGDLDADGDLDVVSGDSQGGFRYFRNTGTPASPVFIAQTGSANPLNGFDLSFRSSPALGDLDDDGDLDLLAGENVGTFGYFRNSGTPASPAFAQQFGISNPFNGVDVGTDSRPALKDVDRDGDLDAVVGRSDGTLLYFENTGSGTAPAFVQRTGAQSPLNGQDVGLNAAAALGDLDGDGDADLVSGELYGKFLYFENAIVRPSPRYVGPITPPFEGVDVGAFSTSAAGDIDGDGDPDFVASQGFASGAIHYFENTGSAIAPKVIEHTGGANPFDGLDAGFTPHLALADLDADGDLDLVSGEYLGSPLRFFENTGLATAPAYLARTGSANPFNAVIQPRSAPAFGDVDGDGDLDLVVGEVSGVFHTYQNTGDAETPMFVELTGGANPLNGLAVVNFAMPALGDVDRDGDLDLVAGDEGTGRFSYFENIGSATAPAFVARTGAENPLDGKDVGLDSSPAFVDLDADADLDLVSGEQNGALVTFYLPEPSGWLQLGAGAGLIAWLARRRRRSTPPSRG